MDTVGFEVDKRHHTEKSQAELAKVEAVIRESGVPITYVQQHGEVYERSDTTLDSNGQTRIHKAESYVSCSFHFDTLRDLYLAGKNFWHLKIF